MVMDGTQQYQHACSYGREGKFHNGIAQILIVFMMLSLLMPHYTHGYHQSSRQRSRPPSRLAPTVQTILIGRTVKTGKMTATKDGSDSFLPGFPWNGPYIPDGLSKEEYQRLKQEESERVSRMNYGAWGPRFRRTSTPEGDWMLDRQLWITGQSIGGKNDRSIIGVATIPSDQTFLRRMLYQIQQLHVSRVVVLWVWLDILGCLLNMGKVARLPSFTVPPTTISITMPNCLLRGSLTRKVIVAVFQCIMAMRLSYLLSHWVDVGKWFVSRKKYSQVQPSPPPPPRQHLQQQQQIVKTTSTTLRHHPNSWKQNLLLAVVACVGLGIRRSL